MASYQFLNHPNQVRDSSCFMINTTARHGFSKSQMCLQKILHIITSYPPQEISKEASLNGEILEFEENRGIDIDLNMGLSPAWSEANDHENHSPESSSLLSASSFVEKGLKNDSSMEVLTADKSSSEGECCLKVVGDQFGRDSPTIQATGEEPQVVDNTTIEISKTTNFKHPANEINCKIEVINDDQEMAKVKEEETKKEPVKVEPCHGEKKKTNKDCLDLLIEAAGMVSGNSEDKESDSDKHEETKRSRKCSLVVDLYEDNTSSPAVRSKRRRSQVLPHRYRDSSVLLEPWKRIPKPQKAETTAATAVSKKRKSG
ncbi:FK506-binding protein [Salix suchowensis]|nr:FK506-binding protein [Salix suchowensis]